MLNNWNITGSKAEGSPTMPALEPDLSRHAYQILPTTYFYGLAMTIFYVYYKEIYLQTTHLGFSIF